MHAELTSYVLLRGDELKGEFGCPGPARLVDVYLSSIALVAHLELELPKASIDAQKAPGHDTQEDDGPQPQIRTLMRLLLLRLRDYDVDCPGVVVLSPPETTDSTRFVDAYGSLAYNQEWHRGEFLVFVAESAANATQRLTDLLAPKPPEPEVLLSRSAQTLNDVIESCTNAAANSLLLRQLLDAWNLATTESRDNHLNEVKTSERASSRGERAVEEYLSAVRKRANTLLQEI